jgi:hypothetical protein
MSGVTPLVDTLLATRLAQRPDLVPLKAQVEIAGPGAVPRAEKVVNDVRLPSRAALEQQLGVALSRGGDGGSALLPASPGAVTLSAVARAISAILASQAGPELKIRGAEPLWTHRRAPMAPVLAARLASAVNCSGLFYEAHLEQFAAGSRTLAQLVKEPQAGLMLPSVSAPADADTEGGPVLQARQGGAGSGAADKGGQPGSVPAAVPVAVPAEAGHSSVPSYGRTGKPEAGPAIFRDMAAQEPDGLAPAHPVATPASDAPAAAAIHPDAVALVRQQLELLALPVFRWGGEAWPGTPLDWEIREEQGERQPDGEPTPPAWVTHLSLSLPSLKTVEVRLALSGAALQVRFTSDQDATLAVLEEGRQSLTRRFEAVGLQLNSLQFGAGAAETATQAIRAQEGQGE